MATGPIDITAAGDVGELSPGPLDGGGFPARLPVSGMLGGAGANDLCDKDANDLTPATGCEIRFTP